MCLVKSTKITSIWICTQKYLAKKKENIEYPSTLLPTGDDKIVLPMKKLTFKGMRKGVLLADGMVEINQ